MFFLASGGRKPNVNRPVVWPPTIKQE